MEVGIQLGYYNKNVAYIILKISHKKVYTRRHVTFFENEFPGLVQEPESDPSSLHFSNDPFEVNEDEEFYEFSEEENPEEDTMPEEEENIVEAITVYAEEERSSPEPKRIRVIGPKQPTLVHSDISQEKSCLMVGNQLLS
ncbi:hypothetical protein O181_026542 [Austropuccinia psidii MF-1]|uniref:Retroviral polymerase SH3-like domain-containing protein n=1 Tax=Austropuccinia psidii MF-1 TaxID=1389203 RepID=A0A9Q3CQT2_9BASI|nr:hypothetical protein [Austropuccinia psidii MF-1]